MALDFIAEGGEFVDLRLRRAADVAVVEPADLGQGNNAAVLGWLDARGSGASFSSARCVREPW